MPCAASPPSAFCQEKVTTSVLAKSIGCAKIAEVASANVSPVRSLAIQSPLGTRTPEVVPFQVNSTSRLKSTWPRLGRRPYSALRTGTAVSFSCLLTSLTQPSPKLSQVKASMPRAPSMPHMAISKAPVSEAGTMAHTYSGGSANSALVLSMASFRRALPSLARCERPRKAFSRLFRDQPGRLAQGPDEKWVLTVRVAGLRGVVISLPFQIDAPRWGGVARGVSERKPAKSQGNWQRMTATMQIKAGNRRRLSPPLAQFVLGVLDGIGAGTPQGAQTTVSARRTCTDCWRRARFTSCRRS